MQALSGLLGASCWAPTVTREADIEVDPDEAVPRTQGSLALQLFPCAPGDEDFRARVKALLATPKFAPREGLTMLEQTLLSYERLKILGKRLGLGIRDVVERPQRFVAALDLVGCVDGTLFTAMFVHYALVGGSLLRFGDQGLPEIQALVEELDSLTSVGTILITEAGFGNNAVSLETMATYDEEHDELVISTPRAEARKWMPNCAAPGVARLGVVMSRLFVRGQDHGVVPVIVRLRTEAGVCPGVSIVPLGEKPGYALDNAIISFDNVRVPVCHLLLRDKGELHGATPSVAVQGKRHRFLQSIEQLQLGRIGLSGVSATFIGASAYMAINYGLQRRTFAPKREDVVVWDYLNYRRDALSALACSYASRLFVNAALRAYVVDNMEACDRTSRIVCAAKVYSTYGAERHTRLCRERCGAAGLFAENRLSVWNANSHGLITGEGDNQVLLIKIARQMLLGQAYELPAGPVGVARGAISEPPRLLSLLRQRERLKVEELRSKMAVGALPWSSLFEVWNDNINLAIEAATAHASRMAAEAFWQALPAAAERGHGGAAPLAVLFKLFSLQELEPSLAFLLAEGCVTASEVKSHGQLVDGLCKSLGEVALELATALDVPNEILRAPLASADYISASEARVKAGDCSHRDSFNSKRGGA